jgi:KDO2-lipid IV(A) lauroyltransferase
MTTRTKYKIEYYVVKTLIFILNLAPYRLALFFGDFIGFVAFSIIGIRRKVTLENLKNSFGDKYTDSEYRKIGARSYRNLGRGFVEYGLFPSLKNKELSKYITFEGEDILKDIMNAGKGAVLVTGHFGSWELMGAFISRHGYPIDYLVGEQHNLLVNKIMNDHRRLFGIGLIEMGVAARGVFKAVKNGRMVCMLSDQDAGSDGAIINFLGRPASTPKGPAAFAIKTGAPLGCGFMVRNGIKQKVVVEPPIEFRPTGNKEEDITNLTQAYTSVIEKFVRRFPDHWFWAHRRWKSTT